MTKWLSIFVHSLVSALQSHRDLAFENLILRQQLAVMKRSCSRPSISRSDRQFWVLVSRVWPKWRDTLFIVKPETIIHWHKKGFRRYWTRKSRRKGWPQLDAEIRKLIRRMSVANPLWGAPRIHGELLKLGLNVSEATVSKYMTRHRQPPSQSWRTFLANHASDIVAIDFLTVPTATFRVLFVLVILSHDRRKMLHTNVTEHPTASWTARQVLEAIGIVGERHLRRVVRHYVEYYNGVRTHLSLDKDAPAHHPTHPPEVGSIRSKLHCGGLHHEYLRAAA
jgi:putative transposase